MLLEFYAGLSILTILLFLAGFFGVPKQDRNTRLTLMMIVVVLSFAMLFASFDIQITNCAAGTNSTCSEYIEFSYDCQITKCANISYDLVNETHTVTCTDAGLTCSTQPYTEYTLIGLFLLLAALSLIYVLMEALGYLPKERAGAGFAGAENLAPKDFGQA